MNRKLSFSVTAIIIATALTISCGLMGEVGGGDDEASSSSANNNGSGNSSSSVASGGSSSSRASSSSSGNVQGGISYGTLSYEGKNYKTVQIGTQLWMAENLNYSVAGSKCYGEGGGVKDGSMEGREIGEYLFKTLTNAEIQANCATYGRLYNWATAMALNASCNESSCASQVQAKHRGICPANWHIPSKDELQVLVDYVGGISTAVTKLKTTSGWEDCKDKDGRYDCNGTNNFGFSALPGGFGYIDGNFYDIEEEGIWQASTEYSSGNAWSLDITKEVSIGKGESNGKKFLYSVRCVHNDALEAPSSSSVVSSSSSSSVDINKTFTDERDGKTYKFIEISTQTWMAENLNYATGGKCYGEDGQVYDGLDFKTLTNEEVQANCTTYGRLYNWETAKTACPSGWHLPSNDEWDDAFMWSSPAELNATDGFLPLLGGGGGGTSFNGVGSYGYWWSSDEINSSNAYFLWYTPTGGNGIMRSSNSNNSNKTILYSVRCVKN